MIRRPPRSTLFPYPALFQSPVALGHHVVLVDRLEVLLARHQERVLPETAELVEPHAHHLTHAVLRSEEHTSELQSRQYLVCRLLLEKKIPNPVLFFM